MNIVTNTEIERTAHAYFSSAVAQSRAEKTKDGPAILAARRCFEIARKKRENLLATARAEFAASRGWILSPKPFSLDALRAGKARPRASYAFDHPCLDHPEFFSTQARTPAAILSHSYAPITQCIAYAKGEGLNIQVLRLSYYNPHGCTAFVLTRREGRAT